MIGTRPRAFVAPRLCLFYLESSMKSEISNPKPKRQSKPSGSAAQGAAQDPRDSRTPPDAVGHAKPRTRRKPQTSIASILDTVFGPLADCHPDLWDRRAYLMLVGTVYQRLARAGGELPTDELVALAKALAESRRAHARRPEAAPSPDRRHPSNSPPPQPAPQPQPLTEAVRGVYGADLPEAAILKSELSNPAPSQPHPPALYTQCQGAPLCAQRQEQGSSRLPLTGRGQGGPSSAALKSELSNPVPMRQSLLVREFSSEPRRTSSHPIRTATGAPLRTASRAREPTRCTFRTSVRVSVICVGKQAPNRVPLAACCQCSIPKHSEGCHWRLARQCFGA